MIESARLTLNEPAQRAPAEVGYVEMAAVQEAGLPAVPGRRDVTVQALAVSGESA